MGEQGERRGERTFKYLGRRGRGTNRRREETRKDDESKGKRDYRREGREFSDIPKR